MEDYNFESQLKRKLNERTIAPSDTAWNRIANRDRKKKNSPAKWYWIAAAIAIGFGFYFSLENQKATPVYPVATIEKPLPQKQAPETQQTAIAPIPKQEQPQIVVIKTILPKAVEELKEQPTPGVTVLQKPITDFQEKANEIAATLEKMQHSGTEITEVMLDSMIRAAHMEIVAQRMQLSNQKTDPSALLGEAEKELDKSFKDRIFDALHGKIKIAFGERNP